MFARMLLREVWFVCPSAYFCGHFLLIFKYHQEDESLGGLLRVCLLFPEYSYIIAQIFAISPCREYNGERPDCADSTTK